MAAAAAGASPSLAQERAPYGSSPPAWIDNVRLFPAKTGGDPMWNKRLWIERTARLLRGGEGLGPDDDLAALLPLSEEEIARRFMKDPRFGDTILDFNLFFLGFKPDSLKTDGVYNRPAFDFSNAVAAAQALLKGGDYLKLFDLEGEFFMAPLRKGALDDRLETEDAALSPEHLRRKVVGELRAAFAAVIAHGTGAAARPNADEYCDRVLAFVGRRGELMTKLTRAFDDHEILILKRGHILAEPFDGLARVVYAECDGAPEPSVDVPALIAALNEALAKFDRAFIEIFKHEPAAYRPRSVAEFRSFDLGAFPNSSKWLAFGYEQAVALSNSSSNYNRRRAAYVLKRFFCDDIVATPPETPQNHAGAGAMASSCSSCHSKLDPMAGFFRNHGNFFGDFSRQPEIVFDDLAGRDRVKYETAWRAPKNSGRQWNIGYIRSSRTDSHNVYGESLADLSRILRTAPEVKRCLMRRLFEYAVAEDQLIDAGFLDHLTREFEREAAVDSSAAMRNAIVRIVRSQTYHRRNADPRQCYDYAPGARPEDMPPCRVSHILAKNCTGCHDSAYGPDSTLDLTAWILAPGGKVRTFAHVDDLMQQRGARDTLARLVERLTTADAKARMPKNRMMRVDEREDLLKWARQELLRIEKLEAP
jgi:hypothetical protein